MISYIESFFTDPVHTLIFFLLAFPGRILALSVHEFAHAWVANRCGDPTAKMLGRMTINPLKHLDPLGTILMLVVGYGWARPVPVNPRNYRNYRKDDLKVSLAGVTMNAIMFILSILVMLLIVAFALTRIPSGGIDEMAGQVFRASYSGEDAIFILEGSRYSYIPMAYALAELPYASEIFIAPVFGAVAGHLYQMLDYFAVTNLVLCLFNLIPVPPLDGYHVLNDLVLRRSLFANPRTAQITHSLLFVLVMTGVVGRGLGWLDTRILTGAGSLAAAALRAMGLMG